MPQVLTPTACRVRFGRQASGVEAGEGLPVLGLAIPALAGATEELILGEAAEPVRSGDFTLFHGKSCRAGFALAAEDTDLEEATTEIYRQLFEAAEGLHLQRIWNYVPAINATTRGLENYRHFCRGRSRAFESHFGPGFQRYLPAASAVGAMAGPFAVAFLAGRSEPRYIENPHQVPAFEYPVEYGPRPPSFSRATVAINGKCRQIFISGTAAIRGHRSVAPGDLEGQLACTLENLRYVGEAASGPAGLESAPGRQRTFKVYIRRASDLARVSTWLERELLGPDDTVSYLHADVCRADLMVEIEAVLTDSAFVPGE